MKSVSFLPSFQSAPFVLPLAHAHLWSELVQLNKLAEKCLIISLQVLVFCHFNALKSSFHGIRYIPKKVPGSSRSIWLRPGTK